MKNYFGRINVIIREYSLRINRRKFFERFFHSQTTKIIIEKSTSINYMRRTEFEFDFPDLIQKAREFHQKRGYFPISFSKFDNSTKYPVLQKPALLSSTIPGQPYSYDSYSEYLAEYENSAFAITHKKGGWDCYRHIEIMESGCIPLMHDSKKIPEGSMFYYPKTLFAEIYSQFLKSVTYDQHKLQVYLSAWFDRYLTSQASVHNMLVLAGINPREKKLSCLFVDLELNSNLDYLSAMILSGLLAQES